MNYDVNKILDIDCEALIKERIPLPTIADIVNDLQGTASYITSILESPRSKKYEQYVLDNMANYREDANAVSYFLRTGGIPGIGKPRMQRYVPKLQKLAEYDKSYLIYLDNLK